MEPSDSYYVVQLEGGNWLYGGALTEVLTSNEELVRIIETVHIGR